jgi:hypothetical protein
MKPAQAIQPRRLALTLAGFAALGYALVPPIKPELIATAGGLLGFDPVYRASQDADPAPAEH